MSHWLSNWYLTILLDTVIWDTCLWDNHRDPMCLKSIQMAFRPLRCVSRNGKTGWLHKTMSYGVCDWRWSQQWTIELTTSVDCWFSAMNMPHAVARKQVRSPHEASEKVPANGVSGDAGTCKIVSSDVEDARQASEHLAEFSLRRNRQNCSMQIAQCRIAQCKYIDRLTVLASSHLLVSSGQ